MNTTILSIIIALTAAGIFHADDRRVAVSSIKASSSLPDNSSERNPAQTRHIRYCGDKAFDNRQDTVWAEGVPGAGVGENISIKLENTIRFDAIEIMPGYFDEKYFTANNRIKRFRLEAGEKGEWKETFLCRDAMIPQRFKLSKQVSAEEIRFFILETYKGSRWDDTCLAELTFFSGEDRYLLLYNRVEYAGGQYRLAFTNGDINLIPKGYGMVLILQEGGGLSGDFAMGHQVGMAISQGSWRFHPDGTIDITYTHGDGQKRMGPDDEDLPPSGEVSGRMKLRLLGEFPPGEYPWFGNGMGIYCIILSDSSNGR